MIGFYKVSTPSPYNYYLYGVEARSVSFYIF
jgi:hypothetical protein